MRTVNASVVATCVGTAVGLAAWILGMGRLIWPAHPQVAGFLLTLGATVATQAVWSGLRRRELSLVQQQEREAARLSASAPVVGSPPRQRDVAPVLREDGE